MADDYDSIGRYSDLSEQPGQDGMTDAERMQGGALVDVSDMDTEGFFGFAGGDEPQEPREFDSNLAEELDENEQTMLGQKLREYYDIDIESRKSWEAKMLTGMELIGLEDVPLDSTAFDGAAQINHPALAEAMVQSQARSFAELMPPDGPVKCKIFGQWTQERESQRKRVEEYMNYQLTEEDDQYYWDTDSMLFYLPYAGSAFKKVAVSPITGTTRSRFIRATDFVVPYEAKSLADASRYTHRYTMSKNSYKRAVDKGYFIDAELPEMGAMTTESHEHRELQDKSDDRVANFHADDTVYTFCETHIEYDFEWETEGRNANGEKKKYSLPYVITWEYESGRVVRIQRLWEDDDERCQKQIWFVHYKYLPGLGFYGFGLLHIIGSLGRAASGALRAVLDGSMTASLQGGFKSRDARMAGDFVFQPGVWQDVDMTAEDLAKSFYTPPFKEPSPALFKTLELIINGIQRFASTTESMVGDQKAANAPVGTTVAMIEQGSKVFSGIHKRLHLAQRQEFKLIAMSNFRYMEDDEYPYETGGEDRQILRKDFDGRVDIVPVSDPNIFSSTQRIALGQAVVQVVGENPDIYDRKAKRKAHRFFLDALKVPIADELLPENIERRVDPVTENQGFWTGQAAKAFAEQDHQSHIQLHMNILSEIANAGDPELLNQVAPVIKAHIAEHFGWSYRLRVSQELEAKTQIPLPMIDPTDSTDNEEMPIDIENAVAQAVAKFVAPPPPPAAPADPEAAKDQAASREADRKDMLAGREADRKDVQKQADLKRDGIIDDSDDDLAPSGLQ